MSKQFTAEVVEEFVCKLSGQYFRIGSQYVGDEERVQLLADIGYVEGAAEVASSVPDDGPDDDVVDFPKHVGGGIYELPNGDRVRGKAEAIESMTIIDKNPDKNPDE